jgi:DNA-binding NarL/FixJ family response regulator
MILLSQTSQRQEVLDLASALHQIIPQRPVLLATSSLIELDVDALAQAGISEVLRRPLGSSELAAALSRCLHSSTVLQP